MSYARVSSMCFGAYIAAFLVMLIGKIIGDTETFIVGCGVGAAFAAIGLANTFRLKGDSHAG